MQPFGDGLQFRLRVQRTRADDDQRAFGLVQQRRRRLDRLRIRDRRGHRRGWRRRRQFRLLAPYVDRAFQRDGARPAGGRLPQRFHRQRGGVLGRADAGRELRDVAKESDLVVDLVEMAMSLVDGEGGDLPDQRQHRRVQSVGGQQRARGVQQTGAGHDREGLRPAGGQRGPERHVGGGLLVAGMNDADAVAGLERGIEQVVVVDAGKGVQRVDAVGEQGLENGLGGGHARHGGSFGRG